MEKKDKKLKNKVYKEKSTNIGDWQGEIGSQGWTESQVQLSDCPGKTDYSEGLRLT